MTKNMIVGLLLRFEKTLFLLVLRQKHGLKYSEEDDWENVTKGLVVVRKERSKTESPFWNEVQLEEQSSNDKAKLWHRRFGNVCENDMLILSNHGYLVGS
ncbi:hypothetical protein LXL04_027787 [Taraxacum kok-saghyz]